MHSKSLNFVEIIDILKSVKEKCVLTCLKYIYSSFYPKLPKDVVLSGQPVKRDVHIATYTNTYNAAMHNGNNTVIITLFLSFYLTHDWQS